MARGRRQRVEEFSDDEENHDHNEADDEDLGYSAATAINHPHKAPRLSNVAFQATGFDKSNIIQPLSQMKDVLLTLLQRFKSNKEEIALSQLQTWSQRILALSKKIILIEYKFLHADPIMNDHLNEYISSEGNNQFDVSSTGNSSSSSTESKLKLPNTTLMIDQINQKIDEELEKISVTDHDFFVKVNQISKKISGVENDDEDFEIVEHEEEMSAESFKCPVTKMAMTNPMKNCNPNKTQSCIHTVSKEGLELLMRGKGQISCPVGGCSGRWMKNHIAVDDNFLRKIKKFERQQTLRSQVLGQFASQSTSNRTAAIALDDD